ncbi:flagellar basal body rod C-terminal domain-containing protein [Hydrogenimonas sp.]
MTGNINAMGAHTAWMNRNVHNIANVNTQNFDAGHTVIDAGPRAVTASTGRPTDLAKELPDQIVVEKGFSAQVSAVKTQDDMLGTLLDMKG